MLKFFIAALIAVVCLAPPAKAQEKSWQQNSADGWRKSQANARYNATGCSTLPRRQAAGCRALKEEFAVVYGQSAENMLRWDRGVKDSNVNEVIQARLRNFELGVERAKLLQRDWVTEFYFKNNKWIAKQHGALSKLVEIYQREIDQLEGFRENYCKTLATEEQEQCVKDWQEQIEANKEVIAASEDRNTAYEKGVKEDYYDAMVEEAQAQKKATELETRNKRKYFGENSLM